MVKKSKAMVRYSEKIFI